MSFSGFSRKVRFTPVPDPVFASLLEQIDDLSELKCTLRVIWILHQKKEFPRYVTFNEILSDSVIARSMSGGTNNLRLEVKRSLDLAVRRGTMLEGVSMVDGFQQRLYVLNTELGRRVLSSSKEIDLHFSDTDQTDGWEGALDRPNIYALYEDNIGLLSPMVAEELKYAQSLYPESWIEDAFREAVINNKRSWKYVAAILERWEREGKDNGGTGRYSKTTGYAERPRR